VPSGLIKETLGVKVTGIFAIIYYEIVSRLLVSCSGRAKKCRINFRCLQKIAQFVTSTLETRRNDPGTKMLALATTKKEICPANATWVFTGHFR
jgi:hypothetical protein